MNYLNIKILEDPRLNQHYLTLKNMGKNIFGSITSFSRRLEKNVSYKYTSIIDIIIIFNK